MSNLLFVEGVSIAIGRGMGSEHAEDLVHAMARCSKDNMLAHALIHLESHKSGINRQLVKHFLGSLFTRLGVGKEAEDLAEEALRYWETRLCDPCKGSGKDFNQVQCPHCDGSGLKPYPTDSTRRAVIELMNALERMDGQMGKQMRGWTQTTHMATYQEVDGSYRARKAPSLSDYDRMPPRLEREPKGGGYKLGSMKEGSFYRNY